MSSYRDVDVARRVEVIDRVLNRHAEQAISAGEPTLTPARIVQMMRDAYDEGFYEGQEPGGY